VLGSHCGQATNPTDTGEPGKIKLIAGRTLLLADDSAAVQKVIELTFADEGMNVVSVGDGRSALEKLEQVRPDVVLADAFMPVLDGYALCRSIKDDQRFSQIPVMLLVSSFAPFDEDEARRAGADDIMTKPFQSIRQLVSRVGSLLGSNKPAAQVAVPESQSPSTPVQTEPNVPVLVEAAQLATPESHEASGSACAPDIEFQTADTAHLDPVDDSSGTSEFDAQAFEDTIEVEPQYDHAMNAGSGHFTPVAAAVEYAHPTSMSEPLHTPEPARQTFNDALLDLDESDFGAAAIADDDVILDLDDESPSASQSSFAKPSETAVIEPPVTVRPEAEMAAPEPEVARAEPEVLAEPVPSAVGSSSAPSQLSSDQLSPEVIDAIARRVIEHLSDRVVREIAWEVVPELSELLIKRKLEEQK
jgi:CheY-like chemotaxis protein